MPLFLYICGMKTKPSRMKDNLLLPAALCLPMLLSCSADTPSPTFGRTTVVVTFGGDIEAMGPYGEFSVRASRTSDLYMGDSLISEYSTKEHGIPRDSLVFSIVYNTSHGNSGVWCHADFTKVLDCDRHEHISCRIKRYVDGSPATDTTFTARAITPSMLDSLAGISHEIPYEWHSFSMQL